MGDWRSLSLLFFPPVGCDKSQDDPINLSPCEES